MSDMLNTIRAKWLFCGALFALIAVPSVIGFRYVSRHRFDASRPHIPELKEVADQIPIYSEFQRINDDQVFLTGDTVSLQRTFRTNAKSADVRTFYDLALLKNGWKLHQAAPSSVIKGEPYAFIYDRDAYQICVCRRMTDPTVYDIWYLWASWASR